MSSVCWETNLPILNYISIKYILRNKDQVKYIFRQSPTASIKFPKELKFCNAVPQAEVIPDIYDLKKTIKKQSGIPMCKAK